MRGTACFRSQEEYQPELLSKFLDAGCSSPRNTKCRIALLQRIPRHRRTSCRGPLGAGERPTLPTCSCSHSEKSSAREAATYQPWSPCYPALCVVRGKSMKPVSTHRGRGCDNFNLSHSTSLTAQIAEPVSAVERASTISRWRFRPLRGRMVRRLPVARGDVSLLFMTLSGRGLRGVSLPYAGSILSRFSLVANSCSIVAIVIPCCYRCGEGEQRSSRRCGRAQFTERKPPQFTGREKRTKCNCEPDLSRFSGGWGDNKPLRHWHALNKTCDKAT